MDKSKIGYVRNCRNTGELTFSSIKSKTTTTCDEKKVNITKKALFNIEKIMPLWNVKK